MEIKNLILQIEDAITQLEGVTVVPHPRFGGRQFEWNGKEIGHIHWFGDLDILFKKEVHDVLIKEDAAKEHQWVPGTGWITFSVINNTDIHHALELLKFSYYQKRKRADNTKNFSAEIRNLTLSKKITELI